MFVCICPKIRFVDIEALSNLVFGATNIFFIAAVSLQLINYNFCIAMIGPLKIILNVLRSFAFTTVSPFWYQRIDLTISSTVTFKFSPFN